MTDFKAIVTDAVERFGSQAKLAKELGCSQQQIAYLLRENTRSIGPRMAVKLEELTDGKVTRYELRPDIFGEAPKSRRMQ